MRTSLAQHITASSRRASIVDWISSGLATSLQALKFQTITCALALHRPIYDPISTKNASGLRPHYRRDRNTLIPTLFERAFIREMAGTSRRKHEARLASRLRARLPISARRSSFLRRASASSTPIDAIRLDADMVSTLALPRLTDIIKGPEPPASDDRSRRSQNFCAVYLVCAEIPRQRCRYAQIRGAYPSRRRP